MNTQDMHTKDKLNRIHLAELSKEVNRQRFLQSSRRESESNHLTEHPGWHPIRDLFQALAGLVPHRHHHSSPHSIK